MSESLVIYVDSMERFDTALADVLRSSNFVDRGPDGAPALCLEGHHRSLYIGDGTEPLAWLAEEEGVTEDALRSEFEATTGVRDPYCLWIRYGDADLLRKFLVLLLPLLPAVVDNDHGLRTPGREFLQRILDRPDWNLTDP